MPALAPIIQPFFLNGVRHLAHSRVHFGGNKNSLAPFSNVRLRAISVTSSSCVHTHGRLGRKMVLLDRTISPLL